MLRPQSYVLIYTWEWDSEEIEVTSYMINNAIMSKSNIKIISNCSKQIGMKKTHCLLKILFDGEIQHFFKQGNATGTVFSWRNTK